MRTQEQKTMAGKFFWKVLQNSKMLHKQERNFDIWKERLKKNTLNDFKSSYLFLLF